jgi:CheY-like chemotaxis protein
MVLLAYELASNMMSARPSLLLIEDCEDDVFFFRRALRKACAESDLTHVADGGAAVRFLRETVSSSDRLPDLIYLDLKMPVLNGFEVLDWIRQQPFAASLRVIVLSGSDQEKDRQRAANLGALRYQVKPVNSQLLREDLLEFTKANGAASASRQSQSQLSDPSA